MLEPRSTASGHGTTFLDASAPDALDQIVAALRSGAVVSFPTDTVYGLAASLAHPEALARLYEVKGRPDSKPIPVLLGTAENLGRVACGVSPILARLADQFWPGALTIVVPAKPELPDRVTSTDAHGSRTVAVRVPDHPLARTVIERAGGALAVTSANRSGLAPALTAAEVSEQLGSGVETILDGGRAPGGVASTVIALGEAGPIMLRQGIISASDLERHWHEL